MTNIFEYKDNFEKYRQVRSILQYGDTTQCPGPKFSIIMPVYGHPQLFIHSFESAIHQDAEFPYEIVIIDNTPLDENKSAVLKIVEAKGLPNVFYYRNEKNIGMTGNWNRGIELARAELITFCHDDDILYPQCLSTLWKIHLRHPNKWIVPASRIIDESVLYPLTNTNWEKVKGKDTVVFDKIDMLMGNPSNGVGCLFYKRHLIELGGYDEEYYPSMDNALHARYVYKYGAIRFRQNLYCYRITNNNESNNVYQGFIDNGLFYAKCMMPYITLPSFAKKALYHAYKTNITIVMERVWAKKSDCSVTPSVEDKIVYKCLNIRRKIKQIGLI